MTIYTNKNFLNDDSMDMFYQDMTSKEGFIKVDRILRFTGTHVNDLYKCHGNIVLDTTPVKYTYNNTTHEFCIDITPDLEKDAYDSHQVSFESLKNLVHNLNYDADILDRLNRLDIEKLDLLEVN